MNTDKQYGMSLRESVEWHVDRFFEAHDDDMPDSGLYQRVMQEVERVILDKTFQLTDKNQVKTARILGINRNTLHKKLVLYKLL